ncbi:MAG: InlB B-repeat-containing protein [Helicobacteraceae bacterium]|nr:InlB B-repeat-containing protein [Helicobacteraceae bacterium]
MESLFKARRLTARGAICALLAGAFLLVSCGGGSSGGGQVFTISFDTDGGNKIPSQHVAKDAKVTKPADPVKQAGEKKYLLAEYSLPFNGWVDKDSGSPFNFNTPPNKNMTLKATYGVNSDPEPTGYDALQDAVEYAPTDSVIYIYDDPKLYNIKISNNQTLTLKGAGGAVREIKLSQPGYIFYLEGDPVVITIEDIALKGLSVEHGDSQDNDRQLVYVLYGSFTMNGKSSISNNTNRSPFASTISSEYAGSAVFVYAYSSFTMNGGSIHGNRRINETTTDSSHAAYAAAGAAIHADGWGGNPTITINGGEIYDNKVISTNSNIGVLGGAIFSTGGDSTIRINGGKIYNNTALGGKNHAEGGAICVSTTTRCTTDAPCIKRTGGEIFNNVVISEKGSAGICNETL